MEQIKLTYTDLNGNKKVVILDEDWVKEDKRRTKQRKRTLPYLYSQIKWLLKKIRTGEKYFSWETFWSGLKDCYKKY